MVIVALPPAAAGETATSATTIASNVVLLIDMVPPFRTVRSVSARDARPTSAERPIVGAGFCGCRRDRCRASFGHATTQLCDLVEGRKRAAPRRQARARPPARAVVRQRGRTSGAAPRRDPRRRIRARRARRRAPRRLYSSHREPRRARGAARAERCARRLAPPKDPAAALFCDLALRLVTDFLVLGGHRRVEALLPRIVRLGWEDADVPRRVGGLLGRRLVVVWAAAPPALLALGLLLFFRRGRRQLRLGLVLGLGLRLGLCFGSRLVVARHGADDRHRVGGLLRLLE